MGIRKRTSQVAVLIACLALAAGCSEDDGFVEPPSPATLTIVGGSPQTGTVTLPLGQTLRVRVTDDDGEPLGGVEVSWAVTAGQGTLATATSTTDGDGVAVNSWTLGSTEGQQTVTASVSGANAVTFTATAGPRTALLLERAAGNAQVALPGDVVNPIQARVLDANGLPLPGVQVTWTVTGGGGSVSPATSTTNALGVATTLWTLGPTGPQTLRASAPGAGTLIFTANSDECARVRSFATLLAGGRTLESTDCNLTTGPRAGSFLEYFSFAPTAQTNATFTMSSGAVDAHLAILRGTDTVAVNNNASGLTTDAAVRVFLAPGTYKIAAGTAVAGQSGPYTFTQTDVGDVAGCPTVFITRGASTTQNITALDCQLYAGYFSDQFRIRLVAGQAVTIRMQAALDAYISLLGPTGAVVAEEDALGSNATEVMVYTPTVSGFYTIDAGTFVQGATGAYTLTVDP